MRLALAPVIVDRSLPAEHVAHPRVQAALSLISKGARGDSSGFLARPVIVSRAPQAYLDSLPKLLWVPGRCLFDWFGGKRVDLLADSRYRPKR